VKSCWSKALQVTDSVDWEAICFYLLELTITADSDR